VGSLHSSVVDAVDELSAGLSVVDAVLRAIVAIPNLLFSLTWCSLGIVNGTSIAFQKICYTDCLVAAVPLGEQGLLSCRCKISVWIFS
jgi:hypothetical protein